MDFSKSFDDNEQGYESLLWLLYWGSIATIILGLMPFIFTQGLGVLLSLAIMIVAYIKRPSAAGTIFASHFGNLFIVEMASWIGFIIFLVFSIVTLGIGLIVAYPLLLVLLVWCIYRTIKGMLRLKEGKDFYSYASNGSGLGAPAHEVDRKSRSVQRTPARSSQTVSHGTRNESDSDPYEKLKRLSDLHKSGVLTDDEFAAEKAKILGSLS